MAPPNFGKFNQWYDINFSLEGGDRTGTVYAYRKWIKYVPDLTGVHVKWSSGSVFGYNIGQAGKVELKHTKPGVWGNYYRDHLPILGKNDENVSPSKTDYCSLRQRSSQTEFCSNTNNISLQTEDNSRACNTTSIQTDERLHESTSSQTLLSLSELNRDIFLDILSTDFLKFYDSKSNTDCTLKAGGMAFPAHRAILSARSTVFEAMFRHPSSESQSGEVDIPDIQSKTLSDILYYIYSGKIHGLTEETAVFMYDAADKYALLDLRDACMDFLIRNLTVNNICDAASLAHEHADENLYSEVIKFLKERLRDVIRSERWKVFKQENSRLVSEILTEAMLEILP